MAFFKNYPNETVSPSLLEERGQGHNADRIQKSVGYTEATSSEREFDINMDVQYQSDGELDGASRLPNEVTADGVDMRGSNLQEPGRKTAMVGSWGSTFWKDCQPVYPRKGCESGQESKSGSDYRNAEGSEDNSSDRRVEKLDSEDDDGQKEVGQGPRGYFDVPAENMLSDEYYEQDGEEQSDSMPYRGARQHAEVNSLQQRTSAVVNSRRPRNYRISDNAEDDDGNNDGDADYEEEDEADGMIFPV